MGICFNSPSPSYLPSPSSPEDLKWFTTFGIEFNIQNNLQENTMVACSLPDDFGIFIETNEKEIKKGYIIDITSGLPIGNFSWMINNNTCSLTPLIIPNQKLDMNLVQVVNKIIKCKPNINDFWIINKE
jgi:hypothetical protein